MSGNARTKPATTLQSTTTRLLLICGILSSLLYVGMNVFIPMQWVSYHVASQTVSELSAIGAPTRSLWVVLAFGFSLLLIAFGWGVRSSIDGNRRLRLVGILMIASAVIGLGWPPMHLRDVLAAGGGTLTDTLHIVWTLVSVPLMMLAIGLAAAALGRQFRLYSIATLVVMLAFGALTGMDAPRMQANLPTPLMGVWERIGIGAEMLWIAVLAVRLLRVREPGGGE